MPDYTMTETEWLTCVHPYGPLEFVKRRATDRQRRLFACACCRRIWSLIDEQLFRDAVDLAEQYADRLVIGKVRKSLSKRANLAYKESWGRPQANREAAHAAYMCLQKSIAWHPDSHIAAAWAASSTASEPERDAAGSAEFAAQTALLRDIFGPLPFRPLDVETSWRAWNDGTVFKLAQGIYDDQAFDRLPILADALEEAGCDNADILGHLRGPGPHVRGCWAVDLLLGKE